MDKIASILGFREVLWIRFDSDYDGYYMLLEMTGRTFKEFGASTITDLCDEALNWLEQQ